MEKKLHNMSSFSLFLLIFFEFTFICLFMAKTQNTTIQINIGVILDMDTLVGKKEMNSISMALSDFYASHSHYQTRLVLHYRNSKEDVVEAAAAALDLLKNVEVQAIIGPVTSIQAVFVIDLGNKSQVPIISYSATSPSLTSIRSPYFIRTTHSDSSQVKAISSIVKAIGWREVVLIYVDNEFGEGIIPFLTDALDSVNARVPYRCIIPPYTTDKEIVAELYKLMTMQTTVFIVHMLPKLGSRLFIKAKQLGMMSKGYAWIITDAMMHELSSFHHLDIDSMQGVIGVKTCVPESMELDSFSNRWKLKFQENITQLDVFDLWAYDSVTVLAKAVEQAGIENMGFQKPNILGRIGTDLSTLGVSTNGPKLLQSILSTTTFKGLSGDFHLVDGQLQAKAYQIVNIIGNRTNEIGFWTMNNGIVKQLIDLETTQMNPSKNSIFQKVIWPGQFAMSVPPKGWMVPRNGKKLRVLVPVTNGMSRKFIKVSRNLITNTTSSITGYCIDVFDAVMASLSYAVPYEYVPFATSNGSSAGNYNDLVYQVHLGKYDAAVGDITIVANRSKYVDFTQPFMESGVLMVVPIKNKRVKNAWVFLKPLTLDLWLTSFIFFIIIGFLVWFLEHRINDEFRGPVSHQIGVIFWFAFSTVVFVQKEKIVNNLTKFVLIIWFVVVLILTQSYTASLTTMLTVQQLQPTVTDINELIRNQEYVGHSSSFVLELLKKKGFDESRIREYETLQECHELLRNGSKNGGVAAVFDEIPYMKLFLARYCNEYTTVQPTYKTNGFGFAFPIGSPLVADISRSILEVTEGDQMVEIEKKWFEQTSNCQESSTSISSASLDLGSFWGLFFLVGFVSFLAFIIHIRRFLCEHWDVLTDPNTTMWNRIMELARLFEN